MSYRTTSALARNFLKLAEQNASGIQHQLLSLSRNQSVVNSGFPYESFNARAMIQPWNLMSLLESVRVTSWWSLGSRDSFMDMNRLDTLIFLVSAAVSAKAEFYDVQVKKRPITVNTDLDYLGKTSFKFKNLLFFPEHEKPLVEANLQFVLIDPKTRRPASPPDWWLEKFQKEVRTDGKPLRVPSIDLPSKADVGEQDIMVSPSDVDPYMHISSAIYPKFCVDSYFQWHLRKHGLLGNGDPFRTVKSMAMNFKGEGGLEDFLKVKFWPSEENPDLFHFLIFKESAVIYESSIEFYPVLF